MVMLLPFMTSIFVAKYSRLTWQSMLPNIPDSPSLQGLV